MAIGFTDDHMIQPKNTSLFGFFESPNYDDYLDMEHQEIYTENRIGLKELNESGGLFRCLVEGDHLQMNSQDIELMIVGFSNHLNQDYKKNLEKIKDRCRFIQKD